MRRILVGEQVSKADNLARICRHPTHDDRQGRFGNLSGIIQRRTAEGAADQVNVLLHHGVIGIQLDVRDGDALLRKYLTATVTGAFGTREEFADMPSGRRDLAALAMDMDRITEIVIDAKEVEHVTSFATSPTAEAEGAYWRTAEEPDGDVNVMDMLLDDMVTREFRKIEPVMVHVGGVGLTVTTAL